MPIILLIVLYASLACGDKNTETPDLPIVPEKTSLSIKADLDVQYQEMIGFGGALTWYSAGLVSSPKKEELYELIFEDLGMDILRLKNWYYPKAYPENKSPELMETEGDKAMWKANEEFYTVAKSRNPEVQVLMSSWGPPASLKNNNHLREGKLKKKDNRFIYAEFAQYWEDMLNHMTFTPDIISIQNEPGYINSGWTTCQWSPRETQEMAGYEEALEAIWEQIKDREDAPAILGPEAENQTAWENFTLVIKDKDYLDYFGWHPYSFDKQADVANVDSWFDQIGNQYNQRPNIMTEYSGLDWLKTARFVHRALTVANSSAYIYWELVWGAPGYTEYPMINIKSSGAYEVTGYYYLMKHFAKYVDKGYQRVGVSSNGSGLEVSAYLNPAADQVTYVVINPADEEFVCQMEVEGKTVQTIQAFQSLKGNYDNQLQASEESAKILVKARSTTTVVVGI